MDVPVVELLRRVVVQEFAQLVGTIGLTGQFAADATVTLVISPLKHLLAQVAVALVELGRVGHDDAGQPAGQPGLVEDQCGLGCCRDLPAQFLDS